MTTPTISRYYEDDHDRLDRLFMAFQHLKEDDFAKACEAFEMFRKDLKRHIQWEESLLFPLFEKKTGLKNTGPTVVMRNEHSAILGLLESIHQELKSGSKNTSQQEDLLANHLTMHNMKEEKILYPAIDQCLGESGRESIFHEMKGESGCCCASPSGVHHA